MPKMKTHSGTKKRITKITRNGKIKRSHAYHTHILTKMSSKRKRQLRKAGYVDASNAPNVKVLLPYR